MCVTCYVTSFADVFAVSELLNFNMKSGDVAFSFRLQKSKWGAGYIQEYSLLCEFLLTEQRECSTLRYMTYIHSCINNAGLSIHYIQMAIIHYLSNNPR